MTQVIKNESKLKKIWDVITKLYTDMNYSLQSMLCFRLCYSTMHVASKIENNFSQTSKITL